MRKVELRMNELEKNKTIKKLVEKRLHKNKKPETESQRLSVSFQTASDIFLIKITDRPKTSVR